MEPQGPFGHRPRCENGAVGDGGACLKSRYVETMPNGLSHSILNIGDSSRTTPLCSLFPRDIIFSWATIGTILAIVAFHRYVVVLVSLPAKDIIGRADRIMFFIRGTINVVFLAMAV